MKFDMLMFMLFKFDMLFKRCFVFSEKLPVIWTEQIVYLLNLPKVLYWSADEALNFESERIVERALPKSEL